MLLETHNLSLLPPLSFRLLARHPRNGIVGIGLSVELGSRGLSSNLYELGANEKIVQRILRHANPHVTNDRYIKAFDPAVPEAMQRMQAAAGVLEKSPAVVQRRNLKGKW